MHTRAIYALTLIITFTCKCRWCVVFWMWPWCACCRPWGCCR